jgi:hypothetical protein
MGTIALTNTVNISLTNTPTGLSDFATNNICIFTNEVPLSVEPYIWAVNANDIIQEYGTGTLTANMGTGMFMPAPNLITGKGQVIVYPFGGVNATSAYFTTHAITNAMLATLKTVSSGTMTLTIDGTAYTVNNLNFTSISTVADIVTVLNNAGLDCDITVVNTNQLQFSSRRLGAESSCAPVEPTKTSEGTAGTLTTGSLTSTMANFASVTDGILNLYVDGIQYLLTDINMGGASDVSGISNTLTDLFTKNNVPVTLTTSGTNELVFTSNAIGGYSSVVLQPAPTGTVTLQDGATVDVTSGTDLAGTSYFDSETCASKTGTYASYSVANTVYPYLLNNDSETAGQDSSGTTLAEAIAEASEKFYFGGVLSTQLCENARILANAQYVQTQDCIYYEAVHSLNNMAVLGQSISSAELTQTRLLCYSTGTQQDAKVAIATYASIACSTNYSGTETALTMNLKTLTGTSADTNLNQTYYNSAKTNGVDIYGDTAGLSCVYSFSNGLYTDEATMNLWLKKALEVALFNYLRKTNTKIPQTNKGITGLKNSAQTVLEQGVRNGSIGTGLTWNDSIPFGDPEVFQEAIEKFGYYIYSIPISQQSQTERENREAPLISIAIKRAGSIHSSSVIINIQA